MPDNATAGNATPENAIAEAETAPVTIKKYANRRLYNTATSSYVTLEHLCQMVKDGVDFVVFDAKTSEDITRQILTQIIVEEEAKGQNLLPISFMRKLIGFYGDNMQWALPSYLDHSMQTFTHNQDRMRDYFSKTMGGIFPFDAFNNVGKQNLAMMEQAMKMFVPFAGKADTHEKPPVTSHATAPAAVPEIDDLRRRLDELAREISGMGKK
jgi:polyhydroxyalkanoate synthesis repressor PhaR